MTHQAETTSVALRSTNAPTEPSASTMSAIAIANVLLRYRRIIILFALLFGVTAFFKAITAPDTYTSTGSFSPTGSSGGSGGGLAAQLGLTGGGDNSQSPGFYTEMIGSRAIMPAVADSPLVVTVDGKKRVMSVAQWYHLGDPSKPAVQASLIAVLKGAISVKTSPMGIMYVSATTSDPEVSRQIAEHAIDAIVAFNSRRRLERTANEKEFLESLSSDYFQRMQEAASRLQQFQMENREYQSSPKLAFEASRLQADVSWKQDLYNSVQRTEEQLRVDAMRNAPTITVYEPPLTPLGPNDRGTGQKTIAGGLVGAMLGVFLAFLLEFLTRSGAAHPDAIEEFQALRNETLKDLRLHRLRRS